MRVEKIPGNPTVPRVGDLPVGSAVVNGEGNLCIVTRSDRQDKVRLVNLENGGTYLVDPSCRHEHVEATVTWKYREVS